MKKSHILLMLIALSWQTAVSQTKEIKGDTAFWYRYDAQLRETLELKDLEKSKDEFNFRFKNQGQVVEISKDSTGITGMLTNYAYHTKPGKGNKSDTLFLKETLSPIEAERVYKIVENSGILYLPSDRDINDWRFGFDGITYIIEHSDPKTYWFKTYWTPTSQDSLPEALIVMGLVRNLSDTLDLYKKNQAFVKKSLSKRGCYNRGGATIMCVISNSINLGYSGSTKLPLGFYSAYAVNKIGSTNINAGASFHYNFDNDGFHHLNLQLWKGTLFFRDSNFSDFVAYTYQDRSLKVESSKRKVENHQLMYGFNLKNDLGLGAGIDYVSRSYDKTGVHLYASKWYAKPGLGMTVTASIFDHRTNYKAKITKSFYFGSRFPVNGTHVGLAFEDFMNYKDLYFSLSVSL